MKNLFSRREFLRRAGLLSGVAAAAPYFSRNLPAAAPSNTLLHASIGGRGMAGQDLDLIARHPFVKLVAIADVDTNRASPWKEKFPEVRLYQDWRELLDREKELDTLNISTPDHMHAPIAMAAMQLGRHVYVQKPLAHNLHETRQLTRVAREKKLITQMGIQIHSTSAYRQAVRLIREGVIGRIREVHAWCGKTWGDVEARPDREDSPPPGFDWDLWLGVASARPFLGNGYYHPANWRKRLDFGTGTFGDMGCHVFDPVFGALELSAPVSVRSEGPAPNAWNWARDARVHYVFPGTAHTANATLELTWYDGDQRLPSEVLALIQGEPLPGTGSVFIGTQGVMLLPHVARPRLLPEDRFADVVLPAVEDGNHYTQFLEAVRGNGSTSAGFDYSGPLTEAVLLGGVASRFPQTTLTWDSKACTVKNLRAANDLLRRRYREGWAVKGLA